MNSKVLVGAILGGIVHFFAGWLLYGMLLMDFFAENAGSATGVDKGEMMELPYVALGSLVTGLLFSLLYSRMSVNSMMDGLTTGLWIGFLFGLGMDLTMYGTTNIANMTAALVDPIVMGVMGALTGAIIGWWNSRGK
ncbi:MAG: hypothetical protein ABIV51_05515 [Saprospiraceae bacterium]